jgi:hypothetical protein
MSLKDQLRNSCDGSGKCQALEHWHGCYADITGDSCDEPTEHRGAGHE